MTDTIETVATEQSAQDGQTVFVPLNKLKKSPKNARKVPHTDEFIAALAASVAAKGLYQNLVVEPEMKNGKPTGCYLVTAGEGRRLAYLLRAKRKEIRKNHLVRCWLDTENDPAEVSLDENYNREQLHPADQFERFHELSRDKGWGAEEIGARFGVSPEIVKRRLRLGGAMATALLGAGLPVRAVLRDKTKGREWSRRGCEVVIAEMNDASALTAAFADTQGVFVLPPTDFDPEPGYPEAVRVIQAVRAALDVARPGRVVCLSTIGADAEQDNLLTQRTMMESALATLPMPITFLRAGWFLDNALWDVPTAISEGVIHSFLQPLDKKYAMVASKDVGRTAAALIRERWNGVRVIELEGPTRVSPNDLADAFTLAVGRPVRAVPVPHDTWEDIFRGQGMRYPAARVRMLDGFNEGWIDFPGENDRRLKGRIGAGEVVASLVESALEAETR